jgi:Flp pilus assembly protein TadD
VSGRVDLGLIALDRGAIRDALAEFDGALAASPVDGRARLYRGVALARLGRTSEAITALRDLADTDDPESPRARAALTELIDPNTQ